MPIVTKLAGVDSIRWWCLGCESNHVVPFTGPSPWEFNSDFEKPTLTPSVLVYGHLTFIDSSLEGDALTCAANKRMTPTCHTFITDGQIHFLSDCTHALAGQTVNMKAIA
jgi:hypothetical protein